MYRIPVYRVALVRDASQPSELRKIASPVEAAAVLASYLQPETLDREHFVVMLLNTKNAIVGINTVSIGTLGSALVHPREVFKPAILANAAAVILAHNHPSGDPTPSAEDRALTRRLVEAGHLLGIEVLDSLVLADGGRHYSMRDHGNL